jgi:hypothetical protein
MSVLDNLTLEQLNSLPWRTRAFMLLPQYITAEEQLQELKSIKTEKSKFVCMFENMV